MVLNVQICSVALNYLKGDDAPFIEGLHNPHTAQDMRPFIAHGSEILDYPRVLFVQSFCPDDRDEAKRALKGVIERAQNLRVFKQVTSIRLSQLGTLTALLERPYGQSLTA